MSRRQVCEILRQRLSDPQEIATARKEAMELRHSNVTKGHRERRVRVIRDLTTTGDVPTLIRLWEKTLAPNVTVSYAATLLKLRPDLRTPMVKDAIDRVRQKAGPLTTKRAKAVTAVQMRHLLESGPERVQRTLLLLFLGACRHADLLRVQCLHSTAIIRGVIMLQWGAFKSDRYGLRAYAKFLFLPPRYRHLFKDWTIATYREVYRHIKFHYGELSVHSLRRGACTLLAELGFTMSEIALLTGHTPTSDPSLGVRRYVDPSEKQPESQLQLRMSSALAKTLQSST